VRRVFETAFVLNAASHEALRLVSQKTDVFRDRRTVPGSPMTMKLYDRTNADVSLDEVERSGVGGVSDMAAIDLYQARDLLLAETAEAHILTGDIADEVLLKG
jgi:hypothetical protein